MTLTMQEKPLGDEIDVIRRELSNLMMQMSITSLESSASSLDNVTAGNSSEVDKNVVDVRQLPGQLLGRLEQEREKRQQLEEELHALHASFKKGTVDDFALMRAKDEELARLTHERNELRLWLQRGVSECRRVAEEALRLKSDLDERTQRCKSIETSKEALEIKIENTQRQLNETRSQVEQLRDKERMLETSVCEHAFSAQKLEEMHQEQRREYEKLLTEAETLRRRVGTLEEAEMCVQLLTERMQQLQMHISLLGQAVRKGDVELVLPEELFLQEIVTEPQRPLQELITKSKSLMHTLVGAIRELQVNVSKFVATQHRLHVEQEATHREHIEAMHTEKQVELHKYEKERDALLREMARLKAQTVQLVTNSSGDNAEEVDRLESHVSEVEALLASNKQLADERDELRAQGAALRAKLRRMKIDWKKVHESQIRFRELQVEVDMIVQVNEKLRVENEGLKLLIETRFGTYVVEQQQQQQQPGGVCRMSTSPTLLRPSISPILKTDDTVARRGMRCSSSTVEHSASRRIEREVFQEWKRSVLTDNVE